MASRKMTFTLPENIAIQFLKRVPPQNRSRYVADALAQRLDSHEQDLIRACESANRDPAILAIESEMDSLPDEVVGPWIEPSGRS